jgi:hypothetical protein
LVKKWIGFSACPYPVKPAAAQLGEVENLLQARTLAENVNDSCSYSWGSPRFSSKKAYSTLTSIAAAYPLFKSLWASSNLGKHNFFSFVYSSGID